MAIFLPPFENGLNCFSNVESFLVTPAGLAGQPRIKPVPLPVVTATSHVVTHRRTDAAIWWRLVKRRNALLFYLDLHGVEFSNDFVLMSFCYDVISGRASIT